MAQKLEFIFDFSSPYGYLGATVTDQITAEFPELEVVWRPYLMGAAMKQTGIPALVEIPIKSRYVARDMIRSAERLDVPLTMPGNFPFKSVAVCRAFYAIEAEVGQPGLGAGCRDTRSPPAGPNSEGPPARGDRRPDRARLLGLAALHRR